MYGRSTGAHNVQGTYSTLLILHPNVHVRTEWLSIDHPHQNASSRIHVTALKGKIAECSSEEESKSWAEAQTMIPLEPSLQLIYTFTCASCTVYYIVVSSIYTQTFYYMYVSSSTLEVQTEGRAACMEVNR